MKNKDSMTTLDILNGFCKEETAWKVFSDISSFLAPMHKAGESYGHFNSSDIIFDDNGDFRLAPCRKNRRTGNRSSDIWNLGATVFELLMGVPVFGGRGEQVQTESTPIPTFRKDRYDEALGKLVGQCLSFRPEERPDAATISKIAADGLSKCSHGRKGRIPKGETTHNINDTLKFWPEKMI